MVEKKTSEQTPSLREKDTHRQYDDSGVFIGLVTVPPKTTPKQFCENEFKNSYFRHREELKKYDDSIPDDYYRAKAYYLFGDFDVCIISLIDDLEFGNRAFQLDHQDPDYPKFPDNYYYQVITGICPTYLYKNFRKEFNEIFFPSADKKTLPFIGISKFKINDGLLLGNGLSLLTSVNNFIREIIPQDENIKFILIETFCNNEICIIFLCNSLKRISEIILSIRESSINRLENHKEIIKNSLLFALSKKESADITEESFYNAHLFTNSHTILGYDLDFPGNEQVSFSTPELDVENIQMYNQWDIKPGHLKHFLKLIEGKEELKSNPVHIPIGRGGLTTKYIFNTDKLPTFSDYVAKESSETQDLGSVNNLIDHYDRFRTYINLRINNTDVKGDLLVDSHIHLTKLLTNFTFNRQKIKELEINLTSYNISYVLRNRILRIFHNYNDAIQDPLLFSSFIELQGFLNQVYSSISELGELVKEDKRSSADFHEVLKKFVDTFDKVYTNRYHQSYRMLNSTDFNIEYNGGIQQLISSYDSAYKAVLAGLGEKDLVSVVEVSDIESVISERFSLKINYLHIFSPELFATLVAKEAANYYHIRRSKGSGSDHFYDFFKIENSGYTVRLKIRDSLDFNKSIIKEEKLFNELVGYLDYRLFQYFFADRLYLFLCYFGNKKMYFEWFFFMYIQNTKQYQKDRGYSRKNLIKQLIRLNVMFYDDNEFLLYMQLNPPSGKFRSYWAECFMLSREIVRLLFSNFMFKEWHKDMVYKTHEALRDIITKEFNSEDINILINKKYDLNRSMRTILNYEKSRMKKDSDNKESVLKNNFSDYIEDLSKGADEMYKLEKEDVENDNKIFDLRNEKLKILQRNFSLTIKEGKAIEYPESMNETSFILNLNYAFISVFHDFFSGCEPSKDFYKPKTGVDEERRIYADPLGGVFIPSHELRKEAFKLRAAFLKTLWNFNYKFKKQIFTKIR